MKYVCICKHVCVCARANLFGGFGIFYCDSSVFYIWYISHTLQILICICNVPLSFRIMWGLVYLPRQIVLEPPLRDMRDSILRNRCLMLEIWHFVISIRLWYLTISNRQLQLDIHLFWYWKLRPVQTFDSISINLAKKSFLYSSHFFRSMPEGTYQRVEHSIRLPHNIWTKLASTWLITLKRPNDRPNVDNHLMESII